MGASGDTARTRFWYTCSVMNGMTGARSWHTRTSTW